MKSRTQLLSFVRIGCAVVLLAGCAPTVDQNEELPNQAVALPQPPASDPATNARAHAIAAQAAAKAKRTEKAEGRQNLVEDRVRVKTDADGKPIVEQLGEASWYGTFHHGRKTATGERFNQHDLTAAHPTLPLGTKATVTNIENGKSVEVVINDRGPYAKGRDLDLSRAAADRIGVTEDGAAAVRIDAAVTPKPDPERTAQR